MAVKVQIFYPELRGLIDSPGEVWADGGTVGECLADLERRFPGVKRLLFNGHGVLHRRVYVFVNAEGMQKADMAKPVSDSDVIIIAVLASGG